MEDDTPAERGSNEQLRILADLNHGMWWEMPLPLSTGLVEKWRAGCEEASYVWDWEGIGVGSFVLDGEAITYNR